jgi:hypothetical protein
MHSGLGTLAGGLPHSDIAGSQSGCRLPCTFRRLQRPSSPLDAKTSVVRPYSITPTEVPHHFSVILLLVTSWFIVVPAYVGNESVSTHHFHVCLVSSRDSIRLTLPRWLSPTTQPYIRAASPSNTLLQLPPGDPWNVPF